MHDFHSNNSDLTVCVSKNRTLRYFDTTRSKVL